jgi:hypothetical protein
VLVIFVTLFSSARIFFKKNLGFITNLDIALNVFQPILAKNDPYTYQAIFTPKYIYI